MKDETYIDEIQKIRMDNNILWMDIVRLAFRVAPDRAKEIMKKINSNDDKISTIVKSLAGE